MRTQRLAVLLLLGTLSCNSVTNLAGSTPAITLATPQAVISTGTPVVTVTLEASTVTDDQAAVKKEITTFMVEYIVQNEIEPMIKLIATEQPPMVENPPKQFLIVASPILPGVGENYSKLMNALDTANAEQVWIYENGRLTNPPDAQKAIEEYRRFVQSAPQMPAIFAWSYDEFGIVSISDDGRSAEVYLADSCGSACGHGVVLTLEKGPSGNWRVTDTKGLWGA